MRIELVILDIDGVMTDGRKYYGPDGIPAYKTYCDKDFTAIKRIKGSGVPVCFLSGDENINKEMAKNRNIPFYSARGVDKAKFIDKLSEDFNTSPERMVYVGDDLFDLSMLKSVGYPFCPSDSCSEVLHYCSGIDLCWTKDWECDVSAIINRPGGSNVIEELFNILFNHDLIDGCSMDDIENLDKREVF